MKKQYVTPALECEMMDENLPLCTSPVAGSGGGVDAGYGGIATGNEHEPSAKERSYADEVEELLNTLW